MTKRAKTKPSRIKPPKEDQDFKVALIYPEDHGKIGTLWNRLNAALPGTKLDRVADVVREAFTALEEKVDRLEAA